MKVPRHGLGEKLSRRHSILRQLRLNDVLEGYQLLTKSSLVYDVEKSSCCQSLLSRAPLDRLSVLPIKLLPFVCVVSYSYAWPTGTSTSPRTATCVLRTAVPSSILPYPQPLYFRPSTMII